MSGKLTVAFVEDIEDMYSSNMSLTTSIQGDHISHYVVAFRQALLAMGFHPDSVEDYIPEAEVEGY